MPTLPFSAATNSTGTAFRAFSGVYTFTINGIPENATVNQITFSCAEGAFTRYTNDSSAGTNESVNANYEMFYSISSNSSYKPSTSGSTPNTLAVGNSNCYSITDKKTITLTGSSAVPTTTKWAVQPNYMSKFSNGKTIYIYFARTSLVTSGTGRTMLQYNTVGGKKGQLICTIEYTLPTSSLQAPTITSLIPTTGSTSYTISWNSVAGATSYKVKYRLSGSSSWSSTGNIYSTTYSGSVSSFGTWQFQIEASNSTSTATSAIVSASFSAVSVLQPPTELSVTPTSAGSLSYTFSWNEATGGTGPYYYSPYCDGIQLTGYRTSTSYSGTVTSYGEHVFKVEVYDIGEGIIKSSNEYTYNFKQAAQQLQAPTITSITQTPANSLNYTVTWSAATSGTGSKTYLLICDGSGVGGLTSGLQASGSVSTYGEHTFKVLAIDDAGNAAYSGEAKHVFTAAPVVTLNPPSNLKITHTDGSSQFTLTWDAAQASGGSGIVTYHIEKLVNGEWDFLDFSNGLNLTETEYSGTIPGWGEQTLAVYAMYGDLAERASITYNFNSVAATKIAPEIIDIDYSPGDTQFYITWSAAYDSSFSGTFYYYVRNWSTGTIMVQGTTATGAWVRVPGYDIKYEFDVYATYTKDPLYSTKTFEYTFDSIPPITLEAPGAPTITQSPTQATFSASWTRAVASDGGTNISYSVYCGDSKIGESTAGLSLTNLSIPNYNISNNFYIKANYAGISANSSSVKATFSPPSMTAPTITVTPTEGSSVTVSWTKPKLSYTTGDITYKLYCKKNSTASSSSWITFGDVGTLLEQNIQEEWLKIKGVEGDIFYFQVDATATNLSHIANNTTTLMRGSDFAPGFTFKIGGSVGYYVNGAWQECTVYYYGWNSTTQRYEWIECIPYYYNGGWREINTKIE